MKEPSTSYSNQFFMLNSLNDIVSFFSIPYSVFFLYGLFVLIQQKRCTKLDCILLAFILFIIFISSFYHFLSKRYFILLFFPSILIIGKAFSLTLPNKSGIIFTCLILFNNWGITVATTPRIQEANMVVI